MRQHFQSSPPVFDIKIQYKYKTNSASGSVYKSTSKHMFFVEKFFSYHFSSGRGDGNVRTTNTDLERKSAEGKEQAAFFHGRWLSSKTMRIESNLVSRF